MKKLSSYSLLFTTVFLIACSATLTNKSNNAQGCNTDSVKFTTDFETGRMDSCQFLGNNTFSITLIPESTPINSSPWYAFKIIAEQKTKIKVIMQVSGDVHRYPPKISRNNSPWQLQPYKLNNDKLTMTLSVSEQPTIIAGQEIINNQYYLDWAKKLAKQSSTIASINSKVSHQVIGQSAQGRPLYKIESKGNSNEWLVIFGRMHPPEVTGALALFPFVETLLSNNKLAIEFRDRYNLLILPNINPDGVAAGNWRFNANGVDLNRDWINFSQPEIKVIDQYLRSLVKQGQKIKFAVDFHSTRHDVFYTMPIDYGMENPYIVKHWLTSLDNAMPNFKVVTEPGNTPNNGVSKQYFADNFNVHAITYEMGDNTDRSKIKRIAITASKSLMKVLLSDTDHNKE